MHTPNANAKICVIPNANPQRKSVEYRLRWVPNAKFSRWPCTFHFCINFIPIGSRFSVEYGLNVFLLWPFFNTEFSLPVRFKKEDFAHSLKIIFSEGPYGLKVKIWYRLMTLICIKKSNMKLPTFIFHSQNFYPSFHWKL